jgi:hypothetical protein
VTGGQEHQAVNESSTAVDPETKFGSIGHTPIDHDGAYGGVGIRSIWFTPSNAIRGQRTHHQYEGADYANK